MSDEDQIPWKKIRQILLIAAALTVVAVIAVKGPKLWKQRAPLSVVRAYNDAMVSRKYESAYILLDPDTAKVGSLENFAAVERLVEEEHGILKGYQIDTVGQLLDDGKTAEFHATLTFEKEKVPYIFRARKRGAIWFLRVSKEL